MILVTGGAGFIGSHVVEALRERGEAVRVLDNLSTGRLDHLRAADGGAELIEGDIAEFECVRRAAAGCRAILHHAAISSVDYSIREPLHAHRTNLDGAVHVLVAAREAGVRRVVLASSASVYGDGPLPLEESCAPAPLSPYALAKLAVELYGQQFFRLYGLETVSLRYFNVYGPRQDPASEYAGVVARFVRAALDGRAATVHGDGLQTRDYVFAADVARANLLALDAPDAPGKVINIASGRRVSVLELHAAVGRVLGARLALEHAAPRVGEIRHSQASIRRAAEILGFAPYIDLEDGLRRTIDYFRGSAA